MAFDYLRNYVPRQMLDELTHRVELLAARGTAHHDDAFPALSDRRWLVNEGIPGVPTQFGLNRRDEIPSVHAGRVSSSLFIRHNSMSHFHVINRGKLWMFGVEDTDRQFLKISA